MTIQYIAQAFLPFISTMLLCLMAFLWALGPIYIMRIKYMPWSEIDCGKAYLIQPKTKYQQKDLPMLRTVDHVQ